MQLINAANKKIIYLISFLIIYSCAAGKKSTTESGNIGHKTIKKADEYLKNERYPDVQKLLSTFLNNYPNSEYADDAAYRLAYLHVVYNKNNPYYDYIQARKQFLKFRTDFPESLYLYACNNWLKVLNLALNNNVRHGGNVIRSDNNCDRLKNEVNELKKENQQLREVLKDLESALDR